MFCVQDYGDTRELCEKKQSKSFKKDKKQFYDESSGLQLQDEKIKVPQVGDMGDHWSRTYNFFMFLKSMPNSCIAKVILRLISYAFFMYGLLRVVIFSQPSQEITILKHHLQLPSNSNFYYGHIP